MTWQARARGVREALVGHGACTRHGVKRRQREPIRCIEPLVTTLDAVRRRHVTRRRSASAWLTALVLAARVAAAREAGAQQTPVAAADHAMQRASTQVWGRAIVGFRVSVPLLLEVELASRSQLSSGPRYWGIATTGRAEIYPVRWLDLTSEIVVAYAEQLPMVESVETDLRLGLRVYPLQLLRPEISKSRLTAAMYTRVEPRNLDFLEVGGLEQSPRAFDWRLRTRFELKLGFALSRSETAYPLYLLGDIEVSVPLAPRASERFSERVRLRQGFGYTFVQSWAFELVGVRDWTRDTLSRAFEREVAAVDVRIKTRF